MAKDEDRVDAELERLANQYADEMHGEFWAQCSDFLLECESPIEKLMATALFYLLRSPEWYGDEGRWNQCWYGVPNTGDYLDGIPTQSGIHVRPQCRIGKYRADFVVTFAHWRGGYVRGAIECDGHDHHNLTKQQAKRDRERDRHFQSVGIAVLRYTGSEIWASPQKCAADALRTLERLAEEDTARRWRAVE